MEFVEEKTPRGYLIKIFFKTWQFLVFGARGQTVYSDPEKKSLLHRVPLIVFVGENFKMNKNFTREYELLKIRNGTMILPYRDHREKKIKYIFLITDLSVDMIPVRIDSTPNIAAMVKAMDASVKPDYVIVDETVTSNDVIIIKNRYRVENVIYVEDTPDFRLSEMTLSGDDEGEVNLNMLSQNPVFLSRLHLRSMNLSKINQLLLDFDLTALEAEYIMNFIATTLADKGAALSDKNRKMLDDLFNSFQFYHYLLKKDDAGIRGIITEKTTQKNFTTFRTMILKVKSLYPNNEEQLLYTEYENMLLDVSEGFRRA